MNASYAPTEPPVNPCQPRRLSREQKAEAELRQLFLELAYRNVCLRHCARRDFNGREILVTPIAGGYFGSPSAVAVILQGTPPRGSLIVTGDHPDHPVFYFLNDRSRRLGRRQAAIARRYLATSDSTEAGE